MRRKCRERPTKGEEGEAGGSGRGPMRRKTRERPTKGEE